MPKDSDIALATEGFNTLFEFLCIKTPDHKKSNLNKQHEALVGEVFRHYASFSKTRVKTISIVSIASQTLYLINNSKLLSYFPISSAEAGIGNLSGSLQTPLGIHQISEKIGANAAIASIFKARKNTGQLATILKEQDAKSDKDNITSRILRLAGLEEGINQGYDKNGENIDSFSRYIYIHGTDEEGRLGQPASHGCIRMANRDIIHLFDDVFEEDLVVILDK